MDRLNDILSRKAAADVAKAEREEELRRAERERGEAERERGKRELRRAKRAQAASGDPAALIELLTERWSLDLPQDSATPVSWEAVRDACRAGDQEGELAIPDSLPDGWRLYRLSEEEAEPFADYLMGDGWLLVTPSKGAFVVVPGEMGEAIVEHPDEESARQAIAAAAEQWRAENEEGEDDE